MDLRCILAALLITSSLASAASADPSDADRATARTLAQEGQAALEKKDFTTAADRFTRAEALFPAPTLLLGLAEAQFGLGQWVKANETYNTIVREGAPPGSRPAFLQAVEDARKQGAALAPRIPYLIIEVKGARSARVTLDDAEVSSAALGVKRPVDPGMRVIRATAEGLAPIKATKMITEGSVETVVLEMKPLERSPPKRMIPPREPDTNKGSSLKTIGVVALGVGGAGLAVGAVSGILAILKHNELAMVCAHGKCPADKQTSIDSYEAVGLISDIGLGVGTAAAIAGTILILTAPKPKARAGATFVPFIGTGYAGVLGRF